MPGWFKTDSQRSWILRCFGTPATRPATAPAANSSPDAANVRPKTAELPAQEPAPAAETPANTASVVTDWPPELGSVAAALRVLIEAGYAHKSLYSNIHKVSRAGRDWSLQNAAHTRLKRVATAARPGTGALARTACVREECTAHPRGYANKRHSCM